MACTRMPQSTCQLQGGHPQTLSRAGCPKNSWHTAPSALPARTVAAWHQPEAHRRRLVGCRAQEQEVVTRTIDLVVSDPSKTSEITVLSGEEVLRTALIAEKVDLYTTWGKIANCGGAGTCGTCIVEIQSGTEFLSERTATEDKKLKGKPSSWRLACQTICGNGENTGTVTLKTQPKQ